MKQEWIETGWTTKFKLSPGVKMRDTISFRDGRVWRRWRGHR